MTSMWIRRRPSRPRVSLAGCRPSISIGPLSLREREEVALPRLEGAGVRAIGRAIGCDASTISREPRRNAANLKQSMSRKGTFLDNSVVEGFFSHLKEEWLRVQKPANLDDFQTALTAYLKWWNTTRIQARLGYLSPDE